MPQPKSAQPRRPVTREGLLVWVMHRFAEEFEDHAVLKGGIALALLDSHRHTNDIDYVFVPYESKKSIAPTIKRVLAELVDASVNIEHHSTMMRCEVHLDQAAIQIEI